MVYLHYNFYIYNYVQVFYRSAYESKLTNIQAVVPLSCNGAAGRQWTAHCHLRSAGPVSSIDIIKLVIKNVKMPTTYLLDISTQVLTYLLLSLFVYFIGVCNFPAISHAATLSFILANTQKNPFLFVLFSVNSCYGDTAKTTTIFIWAHTSDCLTIISKSRMHLLNR